MANVDWDLGYNQGYAVGFEAGYEKGYTQGSFLGFNDGLASGLTEPAASQEPVEKVAKLLEMLRSGLVRLVVAGPAAQEALALLAALQVKAEPLDF